MSWHDLSKLNFAHPWYLCLLVLPALLALRRGRAGGAPAVVYSSINAIAHLGKPRTARAGAFSGALLAAAMAAGVLALARPQLSNAQTQIEASGIDIMIALDVSRSMLLEDFTLGGRRANRVDAVKEITQRFIEARPNDRIGMLAFAGRPYLVSPLTLDHGWLTENIDRVRIGLVEDGTAIGSAIISAANRLKNRSSKSRIVVLLSDGDNNAGRVNPNTAAEAARALGIKVYTIGVGADGFAPMPVGVDRFTGQVAYQQMKSDFNPQTLTEVARIANSQFFRADSSTALEDIYAQIDKLEKTTIQVNQFREYHDLFQWFLGAGLGCLGLQMVLSQTIWRRLP